MVMDAVKDISKKRKRRHGHLGEGALKPAKTSPTGAESMHRPTQDAKKRKTSHASSNGDDNDGGEVANDMESVNNTGSPETADAEADGPPHNSGKHHEISHNGQTDGNHADL